MGRIRVRGAAAGAALPAAVGVTIVVFFMIHLIPGDPAATILGIHATPPSPCCTSSGA